MWIIDLAIREKEARKEGREEMKSEVVTRLNESGVPIESIIEVTGLTPEEIRGIIGKWPGILKILRVLPLYDPIYEVTQHLGFLFPSALLCDGGVCPGISSGSLYGLFISIPDIILREILGDLTS